MPIPPVDGMADLVKQLDRLARRRPRHRWRIPAIPSILFRGDGADDMVRGFHDRLVADGNKTVPRAFVDDELGGRPLTDTDFLDKVTMQLRGSLPGSIRGMCGISGLRLPRYQTLRHVLAADLDGGGQPHKRLCEAIYARRGESDPPLRWTRKVANSIKAIGVFGVTFDGAGDALEGVFKWLLEQRLKADLRFRWLRKELEVGNFLDSGVYLVGRRQDPSDPQVRRVLTLALLRDLQSATRWSLFSPFRRRRATSFVVLIAHVRHQSPAHRWLGTLAGIEPRAVRRQTLMVLASLTQETADDPVFHTQGTPDAEPSGAATELSPLTGMRPKEVASRVLVVKVADGPEDANTKARLKRMRPALPVRWAVAIPAAPYALVAVGLLLRVLGDDGPCADVSTVAGGEVVGVVEDVDECLFVEADDVDEEHRQHPVVAATVAVVRDIADENEAIPDDVEPVTVVFFAPLTAPNTPGHLNEHALNQLRGIALAQKDANEGAEEDPDRVFTRVVLANPGDRFVYGEDVADDIVDLAEEDESVVGVVGIGQSRGVSRDAIDILGRADLPVVAGPVTGDRMVGSSPHYFQVSPRNQRIARMLVDLTTREGLEPVEGGPPIVPNEAVLVGDMNDEYSWNLAYDIRQSLLDHANPGWQPESIHSVSFTPDGERSSAQDPSGELPPDRQAGSQSDVAAYVCEYLDERTVVFYTGRSQQFGAFLRAMDEHEGCPDRYTVVGGSALTKIVEDPTGSLNEHAVSLYYPAFASRLVDEHAPGSDARTFVERFDEAYADGSTPVDVSDAAAAYDAFDAVRRAADEVHTGGLTVTGDLVAQQLGNGRIGFDGATGYVRLGGGPLDQESSDDNPPPVPLDKLVLVVHRHDDGTSEIVLTCGRLADDNLRQTWGTRPCPDAD